MDKPTKSLSTIDLEEIRHEEYDNVNYKLGPNDFEFGIPLGRGGFGQVNLAREKKAGLLVAIKTLCKSQIDAANNENHILREIEIHSQLRHPNIICLFTWFYDERRIYIVLEYAEKGELYKHLQQSPNGKFPPSKAAKYIYQVAKAVQYCHANDVIHGDIKPENILLDKRGNVKLADFGNSVHARSEKRSTFYGTLDYLPPEVVKGEEFDVAVDLWSMGVLLYEFVVGKPPFLSDTKEKTVTKIIKIDMFYPRNVSIGARDIISKLLRKSARKRLLPEGIMAHAWVQKYVKNI